MCSGHRAGNGDQIFTLKLVEWLSSFLFSMEADLLFSNIFTLVSTVSFHGWVFLLPLAGAGGGGRGLVPVGAGLSLCWDEAKWRAGVVL